MTEFKNFHDRAQAGEFDEATAKKMAKEQLRSVRYGDNAYFTIFTRDGISVMHADQPAKQEGTSLVDNKDPDGFKYVGGLLEAARNGGGAVFYRFP